VNQAHRLHTNYQQLEKETKKRIKKWRYSFLIRDRRDCFSKLEKFSLQDETFGAENNRTSELIY